MTTHVLQFVELSDRERKAAKPLDKGDHVEVKVRRKSGQDQVVRLPRRLQPCSRLPSAISSKGSVSRSSPRIRNSARTTRQTSWESRDRGRASHGRRRPPVPIYWQASPHEA